MEARLCECVRVCVFPRVLTLSYMCQCLRATDSRTVGRSDWRTVGLTVGRTDGLTVGRSDWRSDGRTDGRSDSRTVGLTDGLTESLWGQRKTNSRKWRKFTQPTSQSSRSCSIYKDSKPHYCVCVFVCVYVCTQEHVFMRAVCVCVSTFARLCVCMSACVRVKINKYAQLKASCYLAVRPEEVILWYTDNFGQNTGL